MKKRQQAWSCCRKVAEKFQEFWTNSLQILSKYQCVNEKREPRALTPPRDIEHKRGVVAEKERCEGERVVRPYRVGVALRGGLRKSTVEQHRHAH